MTKEVLVADLDAAIAAHETQGYRLDMIAPADAPRIAELSRAGEALRLVARGKLKPTFGPAQEFVVTRATTDGWATGRAGMQYRDLIPGRLAGRFIASHIRIVEGGPVADYIHHHAIRFQMIYCRKGWVRVVYEDQGPPFVMREGDCVLQPPHIRHRVLESSPGLEVIEIANPAEHETRRDHALDLPTKTPHPDRDFSGQRFVRHVAADAEWRPITDGIDERDTGIAAATNGTAAARVVRLAAERTASCTVGREFFFLSILQGRALLRSEAHGTHTLECDDACVLPRGTSYALSALEPVQALEVAM